MMKSLIRICCLTIFVFSIGCASISNGTIEGSKTVFFTSTPTGSRITINDVPYGVTPCRLQLNRWEHFQTIVATKEGYEPCVAKVKKGFNAATLGNAIAGGGIGLAIDVLSGSVVSTKDSIHIELVAKSVEASE